MKKKATNSKLNRKKRLLATKKAISAFPKSTSLTFKQVSGEELKFSRNPAYSYLIN